MVVSKTKKTKKSDHHCRLTVGVNAVRVWVDKINGDPEVWLGKKLMLVLFL